MISMKMSREMRLDLVKWSSHYLSRKYLKTIPAKVGSLEHLCRLQCFLDKSDLQICLYSSLLSLFVCACICILPVCVNVCSQLAKIVKESPR